MHYLPAKFSSGEPALAFQDCIEELGGAYNACPAKPGGTDDINQVATHVQDCMVCLDRMMMLRQIRKMHN